MLAYLVVALLALTAGYLWGYRQGRLLGRNEGLAYAPIELRATALLSGSCPVCQTRFSEADAPGDSG